MTPPMQVIGAAPKKPVKNRVISTVWISLAVAVPIDMMNDIAYGSSTAHFRPYTSDNGAHNRGPNPHPSSKKLVPNKATSDGTPNCSAIFSFAGAYLLNAVFFSNLLTSHRQHIVPSLGIGNQSYAVLAQTEPKLVML